MIKEETNFGILASIDWNSNKWQESPTDEDLKNSKFGFVEDNNKSYTAINFGHELFPINEDGYYAGLLPQLWTKTPDKEKSKTVKIVFQIANNKFDGETYIVGLYAFPVFEKGNKPSPIDSFKEDFVTNIKALPNDIYLLENMVKLSDKNLIKFLPKDKKLGKQNYNYLTKSNVLNLLDEITKFNNDAKIMGIKLRIIRSMNQKCQKFGMK